MINVNVYHNNCLLTTFFTDIQFAVGDEISYKESWEDDAKNYKVISRRMVIFENTLLTDIELNVKEII